MIGLQGKILRSSRLTYRLLTDSDKADLRKILSEEHVTRPGGFLPADSEEKFDIFLRRLQNSTPVSLFFWVKFLSDTCT
jgi:hypothetical protein